MQAKRRMREDVRMIESEGPTAAHCEPRALWWLVGCELEHLRKRVGMSMTAVARASGISKSKVGHMEVGRYVQSAEDIEAFAQACNSPEQDVRRVVDLSKQAARHTWWAPWEPVIAEWLKRFIGLEGFASRQFTYEPLIMPGLLQTPAYARALTQASGIVRPDHVDRIVALRQVRGQRLHQDSPTHYHAVIEDSALRRLVGSPEVMEHQLNHLKHLASLPNVTIQVVIPEDGRQDAIPSGRFVHLEFSQANPVIYAELYDDAYYLSDGSRIATYSLAAKGIAQAARSNDELPEIVDNHLQRLRTRS